MTLSVHTASGSKAVATPHFHGASGTKAVANGRIRTADGTELFYQSLAYGSGGAPAITLSSPTVGGGGSSSSTITITTSYVTATPNGGSAPYSYSWVHVSGDVFTPTNASAATTAFTANLAPGDVFKGIYKCTVTSGGVSADSPNLTVNARNLGGTL